MANFATNNNNRVFYATQGVAVGDIGASTLVDPYRSRGQTMDAMNGNIAVVHGLQSMGVTTNFNLEQIFELGQLSLYENREDIPEIEVTFERLLDGYPLLYHLGTVDATSPTLSGRGNARADVRAVIGFDTEDAIQGQVGSTNSGVAELYCSGMYVSSVSYSLSTDGNFTESATFVGNDKKWLTADTAGDNLLVGALGDINNAFDENVFGSDAPVGVNSSVLRRENVVIGSDGLTFAGGNTFATVVPSFIEGATAGGVGVSGVGVTGLDSNCSYIPENGTLYLNSFSCSVDLGRESINQLGKRGPYYRYISFPVDVTVDIETTAVGGDNIDAAEESTNLSDHSIQIVCDDSSVFCLGNKNKVTSVTYGGGDAGGGNATVAYSMTNSNDFVVLHSGDPILGDGTLAGATYWADFF
jgi:hypothetical protein